MKLRLNLKWVQRLILNRLTHANAVDPEELKLELLGTPHSLTKRLADSLRRHLLPDLIHAVTRETKLCFIWLYTPLLS